MLLKLDMQMMESPMQLIVLPMIEIFLTAKFGFYLHQSKNYSIFQANLRCASHSHCIFEYYFCLVTD